MPGTINVHVQKHYKATKILNSTVLEARNSTFPKGIRRWRYGASSPCSSWILPQGSSGVCSDSDSCHRYFQSQRQGGEDQRQRLDALLKAEAFAKQAQELRRFGFKDDAFKFSTAASSLVAMPYRASPPCGSDVSHLGSHDFSAGNLPAHQQRRREGHRTVERKSSTHTIMVQQCERASVPLFGSGQVGGVDRSYQRAQLCGRLSYSAEGLSGRWAIEKAAPGPRAGAALGLLAAHGLLCTLKRSAGRAGGAPAHS